MFEKLFSFPKRYWLMAHVFELVLGFLVLNSLYPHAGMNVLTWWQVVLGYAYTFVIFVAISISLFPVVLSMTHFFSKVFVYMSEYAYILFAVLPFFVYYSLWLIPDSKWSEKQKYWVVRFRIFWFLISSVAAWVAVFQLR